MEDRLISEPERHCLLIGQAVLLDRHLRSSIEYFAERGAEVDRPAPPFAELVSQARSRVDVSRLEPSADWSLDEEAAQAMHRAIDFAVTAHDGARWLIENDWVLVEGEEILSLRSSRRADTLRADSTATLDAFDAVVLDLRRAAGRVHPFTFLVGNFFQGDRAALLRLVRGEDEFS